MSKRIRLSESEVNLDFNSKYYSNNVELIRKFEFALESYFNFKKKVVALNSGTSAIHMALILSGVGVGDEVICQSFTYVATANPILYLKAVPIFIDSEVDTWNMCPNYLEIAIKDRIKKGKKPKAILVVHLYGMPAKIKEISQIAKKYNIILIEDAAEALGSTYNNQKCGTFGDYGVLSFNTNKIITTFGGGALICNNQIVKEKCIFFANQAKENKLYYEHKSIGYNYRINTLAAAIGINQMRLLSKKLEERRWNNTLYKNYFREIDGSDVFTEYSSVSYSNFWLTTILISKQDVEVVKKRIYKKLQEDNIESRFLWKPMHMQPLYEKYLFFGNDFAENVYKKGLCLPSSSGLEIEDIKRISFAINKLL